MTTAEHESSHTVGVAGAGLPDAPAHADAALRDAGIDPDRLSIAYFGDPALRWTVDRARLEQAPMRTSLLGMTLAHADALELARHYVLRTIDHQQDVTGFDLDIRFDEPTVLQVDFADEGVHLVDPVLGEKFPVPAFCDLPLLRGEPSLQP